MKYLSVETKEKIIRASPGTVILLSAPVGSGKTTFCLNEMWLHCRIQKKQMLLLVNRRVLRGQLKKNIFQKLGIPLETPMAEQGFIEADHIVVTSYQHLQELLHWNLGPIPKIRIGSIQAQDFDYVAFDEIHYLLRDSLFSAQTTYLSRMPVAFPGAVRLYISATLAPVRSLLFEIEKIHDQFEDYTDNLQRRFLDFQYVDISPLRYGHRREVLELKGADADFSYFSPVIIEEGADLVELISSRVQEGDAGKWLVFVESKEKGRDSKVRLNAAGIRTAFIAADSMDADDQREFDSILLNGRFSTQVLLATDVIDNGVSILDKTLSHLVISGFEEIRAVQQAGRIRVKNRKQRVQLFIPRYSAEALNKKRFLYTKKLRAYRVFASEDEEKIKSYLIQFGNEELGGIVYQGKNGSWYANDFAGKALEYFIGELSDNLARLRESPDGYIQKTLGWFELSYDPEGDQRRKSQCMAEAELCQFLNNEKDTPMAGEDWDEFRRMLRTLYETATGKMLCSGRSERHVGVGMIKKIVAARGYVLQSDKKIYKLTKEENGCSI